MDAKETSDDEMNMDDLHGNQKETDELASATEGTDRYIENQTDDDGSAEEEESDDEEEDDTEETYSLTSEGEINPLALTEFDPYQHSEHMEYEALADKKRKAILDYDDEGMPLGKKLRLEDYAPAELDELMAELTGRKRKSKKIKKRGRRKGSKKKMNPEITRKLGDATQKFAHGRYEEAIPLLKQIIRLVPNLPEPYHTLGLIYKAMGDKKNALNYYDLAARLTPKDVSLWKLCSTWAMELRFFGQACYYLDKAIKADPEDTDLRHFRASFLVDLGLHQKAAESYHQIWQLHPKNLEALKKAARLYQKCGQLERSINILEGYMKKNSNDSDVDVVRLLASFLMSESAHEKALQYIQDAFKELPVDLLVKAGICHVHLGNLETAEEFFGVLTRKNVNDCSDLVVEVADSLMSVKNHESALKYYLMLEGSTGSKKGLLNLNIGRCYQFLSARTQAIHYLYKALEELEDDIDARLDLASLLLEEDKEDEAISVLSPPSDSELRVGLTSDTRKPWWTEGKIKLKLSYIYKSKGSTKVFVETIFPLVRETLYLETIQRKARPKKRLPKSVLYKRLQVLDEYQSDNVFHGFRPIASSSDLSKAARAKKVLQKKETKRQEKRAAALAAGIEWQSDESDDDESPTYREPPLPNILKDDDQLTLIVDLCKGLVSVKKYWEALEIVTSSLKLAQNTLSTEKQEELRALGAQIAYNIDGPTNGWDCARYIVTQNPYSFAAWNCYYKIMLRSRLDKHKKFLQEKFVKHEDCIPVLLIKGHQFTMLSQHQAAASCYLKAYKLMPENALVNLCVGTALINLSLGLRLHNKHQCVLQGLAFLYNNLRLSENSQEALYNLARAYHHVGLVSVAATYYEKVLAVHQKDHPIPKLPNDGPEITDDLKPGYCDLKREAAYNLHLIYKNSGSVDLARQLLKDHCSIK
ncbi:putative tetratricopeptide-like helical domain superfamily [Helianthus debilis subsp. tardiflorus]